MRSILPAFSVDGIEVIARKGEDDGGAVVSIFSLLPVGLYVFDGVRDKIGGPVVSPSMLYSDGIGVAVGSGEYDSSFVNPLFVSTDGTGIVVGTVVISSLSLLFVVVGRDVSVGVVVGGAVEEEGSIGVIIGANETPAASSTPVGHGVSVGDVDMDGPCDAVGTGEVDDGEIVNLFISSADWIGSMVDAGDEACGTGPLPGVFVKG